jgi:hypothetical protein
MKRRLTVLKQMTIVAMHSRPNRRGLPRGFAILEFAAVAPFLAIVLLGVVSIGFMLSRSIQVSQITRDAAHMFFDGVDFSVIGNQNVVGRLGSGMGLASDSSGTINTSGNGVVILTQMIVVGGNECAAAGYASPYSSCPNFHQLVIEKRIVIGNPSLRTSAFGSPLTTLVQPDGAVHPADFCTDASVLVPTGAPPLSLGLVDGQFTYGVESYFLMPDFSRFLSKDSYSFILM